MLLSWARSAARTWAPALARPGPRRARRSDSGALMTGHDCLRAAQPGQRRQGRGGQHGVDTGRAQHDHCRRAQLTTTVRFSGVRISRASCPAALNAAASYSPVAAAGRPSAYPATVSTT